MSAAASGSPVTIIGSSSSDPFQVTGKKVLITGSTAGIGFGCALAFARHGAKVYINGRTAEKCLAAQTKLENELGPKHSAEFVHAPGDVSSAEGAAAVWNVVGDDLDVLVCNVGIFEVKEFEAVSDDEWHNYLDVNVLSVVRLCRHYLSKMIARNSGRIVIISSESGVKPHPMMLHYSVTKAAQISLARGLATRTKGTNVTVNSVLPGPTWTEGLEVYFEGVAQKQGKSVPDAITSYFQTVEPTSLLQRPLKVEEVANVVLFLGSQMGSGINGAAYRAEGGILHTMI